MDKQKLFIIGALVLGLVAGYFMGREHLKYEMRSAFEQAFSGFGKGMKNMFGRSGGTQDKMKSKSVDAKINKDKEDYVKNFLDVYDVTSRFQKDTRDGKVPVVFGKLKNRGDKTLNRVKVTVYFLDDTDNVIFEKSFSAVLTGTSSHSDSPLKPNYIKDFGFESKGCPTEWREGNVKVAITDIDFE